MPQPLLEAQLVDVLPPQRGETGLLHLLAEDALADGVGLDGEQARIVVLLGVGFLGGGGGGVCWRETRRRE